MERAAPVVNASGTSPARRAPRATRRRGWRAWRSSAPRRGTRRIGSARPRRWSEVNIPRPWASGTRKSRAPWITRVGVLKFADEGAGRPLAVVLGLLPRRPAELPLGEPELLGRPVLARQVEDAGVADQCLEAVGVPGDPVDHEPAVRAAAGRHPRLVQERIGLEGVIQPLHEVVVHPAGPVLADLVGELLPVAGRAPRVDRHDGVSRRGEHLVVPAVVPLVVPGALAARRGSGRRPGTSCPGRSPAGGAASRGPRRRRRP